MGQFKISEARRNSGMREKIIYQLFLRTFTPEGTIRAAIQKLGFIASLGVDIIYLVSLCEADPDENQAHWSPRQLKAGTGNPKNPYRISDYFRLDPEYGTMEELLEFVRRAHELGLLVMHDLVYLHCGPGKFAEEHPDFVRRDKAGEVICNSYHFPLLNFDNPQLREYLWENMRYWAVDMEMDGFRCDVGDEVPLDFWREGRRRIDELKPGFLMLNEGNDPRFLLDVFDANYDLPWGTKLAGVICGKTPHFHLCVEYVGMRAAIPDGGLVLRAYENHDISNDYYDRRPDLVNSVRADAALVMNFTLDGVPFLYNGNEIADSRRHSIWRLQNDSMCIDWSGAGTEKGRARYELVRKLCRLRHTEKALTHGDTVWVRDEKLEIFERSLDGTDIRVVINFGKTEAAAYVHGGEVLLHTLCEREDDKVTLQPNGYYVEKYEGSTAQF